MSTNEQRLIDTLQRWPSLDDDQLARQSGIRPRQQVNQICRRLVELGRLRRSPGPDGKIINTLIGEIPEQAGIRPAIQKVIESNNFQRIGAESNTHVGRDFELAVNDFFASTGIKLNSDFAVPVGHVEKRLHRFDLGSEDPPILVECKSYTWTTGGNSPSAKIRSMNEVMLFFTLAPTQYRKILFVLKHLRNVVSLAAHYIKSYGHLIAPGVEVWELDIEQKLGERVL